MNRVVMGVCLCLLSAGFFVAASGEETTQPKPTKRRPDVGFLATTQDVVDEILKQARVTKDDVVCDLGCGDGRFVITAAAKYGCRGVGYEIDPKLIAAGREKAQQLGVADKARIVEQDLFTVDLSQVTVVTLFLLPDLNRRLIPQLEKLPANARIISHEFEVPGLIADREVTFVSKQDDSEHLLYFYSLPLKKAGK